MKTTTRRNWRTAKLLAGFALHALAVACVFTPGLTALGLTLSSLGTCLVFGLI